MAAVDVGKRPDNVGAGQYDDAVEEFWRDLDIPDAVDRQTNTQAPVKDIDEEIKITKKRKPVAKLDVERLLSERGVPELRRRARKRVKLSGKGHEFTDMNHILQVYQLWLDDLYPKAKFRDGLAMIEKIGHSKRMNVTRKQWIADTRPHAIEDVAVDDATFENEDFVPVAENADAQDGAPDQHAAGEEVPDEDDLDLLLAQESTHQNTMNSVAHRRPFEEEDDSDQDDLDAILAQEDAPAKQIQKPAAQSEQTNFDDDEEAMDEMGIW